MPKTILQHSKGFSMLEALIGLGIMTGGAMLFATLITGQDKARKAVQVKLNSMDLVRNINTFLGSATQCNFNFNTLSVTGGPIPLNLKFDNGTPALPGYSDFSVSLENFVQDGATTTYFANIQVRYTGSIAGIPLPAPILMKFNTAAGAITGCASGAGGVVKKTKVLPAVNIGGTWYGDTTTDPCDAGFSLAGGGCQKIGGATPRCMVVGFYESGGGWRCHCIGGNAVTELPAYSVEATAYCVAN